MKKLYLFISLLLFLSVGSSQKEYDINNILKRDGVYIKKFSDEIVNGKVFQMFGDNKVPLGMVTNGKINGKWTFSAYKKVAAKILGSESCNGWTYWYCNINGSIKTIDSLRQRFLSKSI